LARRGPYVAQYLPGYIRQGRTGASALRDLRARGFSISTESFYRLWGETQDYLARGGAHSDAPLNRVIQPSMIGKATRPRARGYLHTVQLAVEDPHSGEVGFNLWTIRTSRPLAHGTILRRAVEDWEGFRESEQGALYGRVLGAFLENSVQLVGEDE
jgi:hypothetical protein